MACYDFADVSMHERGVGIFGFADLANFWIGFWIFAPKNCGFSVLVTFAVCGFCFFVINRFSVFDKNTGDFSDLGSDVFSVFLFRFPVPLRQF